MPRSLKPATDWLERYRQFWDERLVFSWAWQSEPDDESIVTITLDVVAGSPNSRKAPA